MRYSSTPIFVVGDVSQNVGLETSTSILITLDHHFSQFSKLDQEAQKRNKGQMTKDGYAFKLYPTRVDDFNPVSQEPFYDMTSHEKRCNRSILQSPTLYTNSVHSSLQWQSLPDTRIGLETYTQFIQKNAASYIPTVNI